jgi:hypothetical protein
LPAQAVANDLEIPEVPDIMKQLKCLEVRCISMRIPFMKIHALRKGAQRKIRGPCINVPANLEPICEVLPRLPEDLHILLLKLKRKLEYPRHYMYDFIRPKVVMEALRWLKANNPFYKHVKIDKDWEEKLNSYSTKGDVDYSEDYCFVDGRMVKTSNGEENISKKEKDVNIDVDMRLDDEEDGFTEEKTTLKQKSNMNNVLDDDIVSKEIDVVPEDEVHLKRKRMKMLKM